MKCPRKRPENFAKENKWYDLFDDWDLIEASFAMQYQIRLSRESDMTWSEFCVLLGGIMPKTPLGQIVSIRSEEDKDMLKNFTPEQHKIRNDWREKNSPIQHMTEEEQRQAVRGIQEAFAKAFG
ncbi:hypothetical protein GMB51_11965 [Turicibacter sanguinis]|nr:hypothetical protein [Turicibacter sanguinis]MTN51707.1 hypothetical protein [Turicibacter sanguinis]MTN53491.1 hypothetical protein [Turicibacter sanguinis]MTN57894.1 hypothetical protein [Turicibacter sanguinis]MTN61060.1 hypothetical protein [Turicibacter sanguinis]